MSSAAQPRKTGSRSSSQQQRLLKPTSAKRDASFRSIGDPCMPRSAKLLKASTISCTPASFSHSCIHPTTSWLSSSPKTAWSKCTWNSRAASLNSSFRPAGMRKLGANSKASRRAAPAPRPAVVPCSYATHSPNLAAGLSTAWQKIRGSSIPLAVRCSTRATNSDSDLAFATSGLLPIAISRGKPRSAGNCNLLLLPGLGLLPTNDWLMGRFPGDGCCSLRGGPLGSSET